MAKVTGTIEKSDLEGGLWILVADDGERYQLEGAEDVKDGQRVTVEGKVERDLMGIGMSGAIFKVKSVSPAKK